RWLGARREMPERIPTENLRALLDLKTDRSNTHMRRSRFHLRNVPPRSWRNGDDDAWGLDHGFLCSGDGCNPGDDWGAYVDRALAASPACSQGAARDG